VRSVLLSLLISPVLGFVLAMILFKLLSLVIKDRHLYEPPEGDKPPVWWMRGLLVLTCTGVSFAHGTNDGQKSIGLIMLAIIGLLPAEYALNPAAPPAGISQVSRDLAQAAPLIAQHGDDRKAQGADAVQKLAARFAKLHSMSDIPGGERQGVRNQFNQVLAEVKAAGEAKELSPDAKKQVKALHDRMMKSVEYAPWWVRIVSALCLGLGTMVGYRRIVKTLGERLGKQHLVPAQGASAELVAAGLIGFAGFTGYPVSTTHVVTGGIAGTMVASGAGVQKATVWQIATAWILTLPATILISAGLFYLFSQG
jgi:inorganic phosphate transporter, PiT family